MSKNDVVGVREAYGRVLQKGLSEGWEWVRMNLFDFWYYRDALKKSLKQRLASGMNSRKNTPQHIDPEQNRNIIKEKEVGQTEENGVEMNSLQTKREEMCIDMWK